MIKVKAVENCDRCEKYATINQVYVKNGEETMLVKEYLCSCGHKIMNLEVIDFVIELV